MTVLVIFKVGGGVDGFYFKSHLNKDFGQSFYPIHSNMDLLFPYCLDEFHPQDWQQLVSLYLEIYNINNIFIFINIWFAIQRLNK